MKKQETEGFSEVKNRLDSLFDVVLKKALEVATVQDLGSFSTGKWARNVQILLHVIETNNEDLSDSLKQLRYLSIEINALSK